MPKSKKRYVAVIKSSAVRDVQFAKTADAGPLDDDAWADLPEAEIYAGTFTCGSEADARAAGASYAGTVKENIRVIPIG